MSHNLYTLNNVGGDVVSYHGANQGIIYIGRGESATYSGSLTAGNILEWYDSDPVNTITGATFTKRAGTNWIQKINLPAGTYTFQGHSLLCLTNSATFAYCLHNCKIDVSGSISTNISGSFYNQDSECLNEFASALPDIISLPMTLSATTSVYWNIGSFSSGTTPSDPLNRLSTTNTLFIRKVA